MSEQTTAAIQTVPEIFKYNESPVRTVSKEDGAIWFVARDVFGALQLPWNGQTSLVKIPDSWRGVLKLHTPQKNQSGKEFTSVQDVIIISEPAVYKLAFRSNKPEADRFTNWVASEVLPSIRKTGAYVLPAPETLTPSEQHEITKAVKLKAGENHKAIPEIWGRIKNKFKVAKYSQIPRERFQEVLVYVSEMEIKILLKTEEPATQEQEAPAPLTPEEKAALIDDIYNQIGMLRCSADGLLTFYRDMNRFMNKIGNLVAILNAVEYKDRRSRELAAGR